MIHRTKWLSLLAVATFAVPARAVTYHIDSGAGIMQQPTSHYYHFVYGAQISAASQAEGFQWRASYIERPAFKDLGYEDKDFGWFTMVGTKLTKSSKTSGVYALGGGGRVSGYIKDSTQKHGFALVGPTVALEYVYRLGPVQWTIGHQTFVGFVDKDEVEAYVAWPYTFFNTTLGFAW